MKSYFIGIDPGGKGAIAILDNLGKPVLLEDIPFIKTEKIVNLLELKNILEPFCSENCFCVHEKCQYTPAIKGSGAFTFGKTIGYTEAFLTIMGVPHELVRPQAWKKEFSLINTDKSSSIEVAKRLYPSVADKLLKTKDGRAEALLLATYCRRKNCGK